ncbi:bone morphogenetic protein 2 [Macrosteles quadrilineatus]|uniref:bone morphogenetic protein 2 n=1 Tax=Macrosteles quadrilineatus TaxID=74068 RepID=UPI0023E162C6|nr:bone morphogenetic protein 2 [Macrosteles quadrilineatus]
MSRDHILLLQQYVMEGLGLTRLPDTTKMNISETEYTTKYETYLQTVRENKKIRLQRDTYAKSQRFYSIAHFGGAPNVKNYHGSHELLYFPVGVKNATVNQATLRIFAVAPLGQSPSTPLTLRVYLMENGGGRTLLDSRRLVLKDTSRWVELDVVPAVIYWISGQRNLGLEVECDECSGRGVRLVSGTGPEASSFDPVLNVLLTDRESYPRSPRAMEAEHRYDETLGSDCRKGPNHGRCCRHSMEVVFKDVPGFEFILQPYKFNAGFCKGRCPPRYHPASQHALLQSLVWQMYKVPRPCCAPHVLADIEVLHLDETDPSSLKVSTWKGMQVQRCACS